MHIVRVKKFNNVQDATDMRANEGTGITSFITTGKFVRSCTGTKKTLVF
jgi:hypothetical protein